MNRLIGPRYRIEHEIFDIGLTELLVKSRNQCFPNGLYRNGTGNVAPIGPAHSITHNCPCAAGIKQPTLTAVLIRGAHGTHIGVKINSHVGFLLQLFDAIAHRKPLCQIPGFAGR